MAERNRYCQERVWIGWSDHACGRRARFFEACAWFCGTHAPSQRAKRAKERGPPKWKRQEEARLRKEETTTLGLLLWRLARGGPAGLLLRDALYDVCDNVHAACDEECPVYAANGGVVDDGRGGCRCFKDGKAMLAFLRTKEEPDEG